MKNKQGLTLVELMIVIMLGSVVLTAAGTPLIGMMRQSVNYQRTAKFQGESALCVSVIEDTVRGSKGGTMTFNSDQDFSVETSGGVARFRVEEIENTDRLRLLFSDESTGLDDYELSGSLTHFSAERRRLDDPGVQVYLRFEDDASQLDETKVIYVCSRND
jgi:prepilin-type N-terminal cleavage/methylation domain-containing protein